MAQGSKNAAFIGLGVMGFPMAGHLASHLSASGAELTVYNRTQSRAAEWCASFSGKRAETPALAAKDADYIFICVGNDDDVLSVVEGEAGIFSNLKPGTVLIDHTTASAELAKHLAVECSQRGCQFLDAPVSGGQVGAETGQLTIMVGGEASVFAELCSLMDCYAKACKHMGASGAGQLTKMVNQICIAGILQGLSEALHFAEQAGLDIDEVVETISKGAAQSWQMDNRAQNMAKGKFDYGFAVDWMRKDLNISLSTARKIDARLPLTALVDQFYAQVQAIGGGRLDTSSLIKLLRDE